MATIYIDGRQYEVGAGDNLLHACLSQGLDIPYFCWHPALGSVGACRQCAVKQYRDANDKVGHLVMSCMTPSAEGTHISIADEEAKQFRAERHRVADDQPPARLPRVRRRRPLSPPGHDGDDGACVAPLPLHQAHTQEPVPRSLHQP